MAEEKKKKDTKKNNTVGTKKTTSKTKTTPKKTTSSSKTTTKKTAPNKTKSASKTTNSAVKKTKSTTTKKVATKNTKTASKSSTVKKTTAPSKNVDVNNKEEVKKDKTIEINQKKLVTGIAIVVLVVSLILLCIFGSDSVSTKYQKSSTNSEESSTDGNSVLEQATKESEEIKEDERTAPKLISVDDYLELYKSDEVSLVLISKESCGYCQIAVPIIENIIYTDGVKINHVDVGDMSDDDTAKLIGSDDYFSEGYGTPLILVVGENSIKDKIEGLTTKEGYKEFFKKYSSEE